MAFHTPHGSARYRLPWSWSSFDYRELCRELWEQCDAPGSRSRRSSRGAGDTVAHRPRRADGAADRRRARLAARARPRRERPAAGGADLARARGPPARRRRRPRLLDRPLASSATATRGRCPAAGEQRVGVGSYEPRHHVKEPTKRHGGAARRRRRPLPGQLVPARAAPGRRGRRVLRRRLGRPLPAAVGRGDPHRVLLRHRLRARAARRARRRKDRASRRWPPTAPSPPATRRRSGSWARLQRWVPRLPPRAADRADRAGRPPPAPARGRSTRYLRRRATRLAAT